MAHILDRDAPAPAVDPLLTVADVARRLNVHEQTVYALVKRGRLRSIRAGRALRIKQSWLDAFIDRGGARR